MLPSPRLNVHSLIIFYNANKAVDKLEVQACFWRVLYSIMYGRKHLL